MALGIAQEAYETEKVYVGGENHALTHLEKRLKLESKAFLENSFLPNRRNPELLCPPKSLSPDLRFGSLSVRRFYWGVMDAYKESQFGTDKPFNPQIVIQLLWREFFYTMSVNNEFFGEMDRNQICINIPWYHSDNAHLEAFCTGLLHAVELHIELQLEFESYTFDEVTFFGNSPAKIN